MPLSACEVVLANYQDAAEHTSLVTSALIMSAGQGGEKKIFGLLLLGAE
jgi:hypothetical protein